MSNLVEFGLIGPAYTSTAVQANCQASVNLYLETDPQRGASKQQQIMRPGLVAWNSALPTTPCRGFLAAGAALTTGSRMFAVGGSKLYEISSTGAATLRGDVGDDATHTPVQMMVDGNQLGIISAGKFYYDNGAGPVVAQYPALSSGVCGSFISNDIIGAFSGDQFSAAMVGHTINITDGGVTVAYNVAAFIGPAFIRIDSPVPASPISSTATWTLNLAYDVTATTGDFLNGYAIIQYPDSKQFNFSGINNFASWNPIDAEIKEADPYNIGSIIVNNQQLWIMGEKSSQVYDNGTNPDTPFETSPTQYINMGIGATWSLVQMTDGPGWLGVNTQGGRQAFIARGYNPVPVSTYAIEQEWNGYSTVSDCIAWVEIYKGHKFWVLTFPTANATWVYDETEKAWHQRTWWNGTSNDRFRGRCHCFCFGKHIVGDHTTGQMYYYSDTAYQDNGGVLIDAYRTAVHMENASDWVYLGAIRVLATPGLTLSLEYSTDGGLTFTTAETMRVAVAQGLTALYEKWSLGRAKDFVFRVRSRTNAKTVLINGWILPTTK